MPTYYSTTALVQPLVDKAPEDIIALMVQEGVVKEHDIVDNLIYGLHEGSTLNDVHEFERIAGPKFRPYLGVYPNTVIPALGAPIQQSDYSACLAHFNIEYPNANAVEILGVTVGKPSYLHYIDHIEAFSNITAEQILTDLYTVHVFDSTTTTIGLVDVHVIDNSTGVTTVTFSGLTALPAPRGRVFIAVAYRALGSTDVIVDTQTYDLAQNTLFNSINPSDIQNTPFLFWLWIAQDRELEITVSSMVPVRENAVFGADSYTDFAGVFIQNNSQKKQRHAAAVDAMRAIGVNYEEVETVIADNPQLDQIDDVFIGLFGNPQSEIPAEQEYCYEFFKALRESPSALDILTHHTALTATLTTDVDQYGSLLPNAPQVPDTTTHSNALNNGPNYGNVDFAANSQVYARGEFIWVMVWSCITHTLVDHVIPDGKKFEITGTAPGIAKAAYHYPIRPDGELKLYKQLDATRCEVITVFGLHTNHGVNVPAENVYYRVSTFSDDLDTLRFVMDYMVLTNRVTTSKGELVAHYSRNIVIHGLGSTDIPWWKLAVAALITIAGIVVGTLVGMPQLGLALEAGVLATMLFVGEILLTVYITNIIAEFFLKKIGGDLGFILAVATYALSIKLGKGAESLGLFDKILLITSAVTKAIVSKVGLDAADLEALLEGDQAQSETDKEEIKRLQELLGDSDAGFLFSTEDLLADTTASTDNNVFDFTETPTEFYNRTIHTSNMGVLALQEPKHFVSIGLELPKPVLLTNNQNESE